MRKKAMVAITAVAVATAVGGTSSNAAVLPTLRTLDGSGNNVAHPDWGKAGAQYTRVAKPNYADGVAKMVGGPPTRYISNRIFNDVGQNLFSERGISQWGWTWGQFMDHDFGLRDETPAESGPIAWSASDPLEAFRNDLGAIDFARTPAAPGTGVTSPRQQINTISSYIDASNVYGTTAARLDWLRAGPLDGNPANNSASLLLPGGYLPRVTERGNAAAAPPVDLMGPLVGTPNKAAVAGDVRANENIALTATHTLFAREHNRIVAALPSSLGQEEKFQIARRVVGAELQYITYNQFLPAMGVTLPAYRGYDPGANAGLSNEFAAVGYRAHSMIHGEFEVTVSPNRYNGVQLKAFGDAGIVVEKDANAVTLVIPLSVAFGNPDLLQQVGEGELLKGLGGERQYKNDEQIDNSLRSVLFQIPKPGIPDPSVCGTPVINPSCFTGVQDLGAIDVERGRDHGMPSYNAMRQAYGLAPKASFTAITGESTSSFPSDPLIDRRNPIDDPNILDFTQLRDAAGNVLTPGSDEAADDAVTGVRRTTLAARLRAVYGSVDKVDAFTGMVSEPHVAGSEFGELQLAMWKKQFQALRDGDRFFYANDPALPVINQLFGIDYRQTLGQIITRDTGVAVQADVFKAAG
jgi:hypothetical protein